MPSWLCSLTRLSWLSLFDNPEMGGTLPACLGSLTLLQDLFLAGMGLSGTIPESLGSLSAMRQLALEANGLVGTLPASLGAMRNASLLWLFNNSLSGPIPDSFCSLADLVSCQLGNQTSAAPLCSRAACPVASSVCAAPACLSLACAAGDDYGDCAALAGLYNATSTSHFWASAGGWAASLAGTPTSLCSFAGVSCAAGRVVGLSMSGLDLAGTLPTSLCGLTCLSSLSLFANALTGPVPACLASLTALSFLALSQNRLSGTLPPQLCSLAAQLESRPSGVGCILADVAGRNEDNLYDCPLPCAGSVFMNLCGVVRCAPPSVQPSDSRRLLLLGACVGGGGGGALLITVALLWAGRRLRRLRDAEAQSNELLSWGSIFSIRSPAAGGYDVFFTYRLKEHQLGDAVVDKLSLAGLRVFMDRGSALSGRPLLSELYSAILTSRCVLALVTLDTLSSFIERSDHTVVDYVLAEYVIALFLLSKHRISLILPLLVGVEEASRQGQLHWSDLRKEPAYAKLCAALPDVIPAATLAAVQHVLLHAGGFAADELPPSTLTVRDIVIGRPPASIHELGVEGILSIASYSLACPQEDLGLYLAGRVVPALRAAHLQSSA